LDYLSPNKFEKRYNLKSLKNYVFIEFVNGKNVSPKDNKMNIHNTLKNKLQFSSKEQIIKKLGYNSIGKGTQTIDAFLHSQNLCAWLHSGYYDFKYTAEEFLKKLCSILDIPQDELDIELQKQIQQYDEFCKLSSNYIFVNTNFKRTTEPVFALAFLESKRRLKIPTKDLEVISKIVKEHYIENNGALNIWGKIENYIFHSIDKTYLFDIDGNLVDSDDNISESKATLTLRGKRLI
jgi:hypothetical protein